MYIINRGRIFSSFIMDSFAILVIDSSASPEFGTLAERLTSALHEGGAVEIMPARTVDELNGRHEAIRIWAHRLGKVELFKNIIMIISNEYRAN